VKAVGADGKGVKIKDGQGVERSKIHVYTDVAQYTKDHDAAEAAKKKP